MDVCACMSVWMCMSVCVCVGGGGGGGAYICVNNSSSVRQNRKVGWG